MTVTEMKRHQIPCVAASCYLVFTVVHMSYLFVNIVSLLAVDNAKIEL